MAKENNNSPPASESVQSPSSGREKSKILDHFWLEKVFPDPLAVFAYQRPPLATLADKSAYVLDANALLEPYKLSSKSFQAIKKVYEELHKMNMIFTPAQAAREFAKNRDKKVVEIYEQVHNRISKAPVVEGFNCPMLTGVPEYDILGTIEADIRTASEKYKETLAVLKGKLSDWGL